MVLEATLLGDPVFWMAAFAGGAFAASIGALPAFVFTGFMVIAGEAAVYAGAEGAITGSIGFGPVFGPHISFAAGAAAAAYAAKQGYLDDGKNIVDGLGTHNVDVLLVGGIFGIIGLVGEQMLNYVGSPTDNIALMVFLSALIHRVVFGYSIIGEITGDSIFDMSPAERDEEEAPGIWLPHMYKWSGVTMIGLVGGLVGGFVYLETGSVVLVFGISAASLVLLNTGVPDFPVTHHITLPGAVGAFGVSAGGLAGPEVAMLAALGFGIFGALMGEVCNRVFYAHGKTHVDPPAFGIFMSGLLATVLALAIGDFAAFWAFPESILGLELGA
ncbi:hypothetical protein [Natranaeroarchaeum sulfidigenes]|uniref:Putative membrane protein n=1 Tax=Natranaeroarchaeum sulfidigenes TaxID=2784880 RepID=A0A897MRW1_9EURY|nr:hypothetical protein [Natranaeroarchaeum sulfidigenes]QSG03041.1 putative membrane protein [Natranaeroarchaeum sulfidigenes]